MGASSIVERQELAELSRRPLEAGRFAGAVDTVGSATLAQVLKQIQPGGSVAACGLAGGFDLPTSVMPFIIRGVSLVGIDSVMCPKPRRLEAWARLAKDLPIEKLEAITRVEPFGRVPELAEEILQGKIRGRVVIDVNG